MMACTATPSAVAAAVISATLSFTPDAAATVAAAAPAADAAAAECSGLCGAALLEAERASALRRSCAPAIAAAASCTEKLTYPESLIV